MIRAQRPPASRSSASPSPPPARSNITRYALARTIKALGLPVERATGGRAKWNRSRFSVPKTHALDAACAGAMDAIFDWKRPTLAITATGRGMRQRILPDRFGFARGHRPRVKLIAGFQTGDLVRAAVPAGKKAGVYIGRVAVRSSGSFNIQTTDGVVQGINHRHFRLIQRSGGYNLSQNSSQ